MKEALKKVQTKLWKYGYSVRDYSESDTDFDLLLDDQTRIMVTKTKPLIIPAGCDAVASVIKGKVLYYVRPGAIPVESKSPYHVFGRPIKAKK